MANFRRFRPDDLNKLSKCNLDPFTETYELGFYLQYYAKWPSLFQVAEDQDGNIIGYCKSSIPHKAVSTASKLTDQIGMGKLESSPEAYQFSEHYLPWHAHITAVTVAPEARRLGIGRLLTEQLEAAADANNAWFVDLFVRSTNHKAIKFYEKMGYSIFRVVKDYYADHPSNPNRSSEDAYDMRKPCRRDVKREHIREDGIKHEVEPADVW
jgi:N-terminal acetyltransferase B complex catalytic subunit